MQSTFYRALEAAQSALRGCAAPVDAAHELVDDAARASRECAPWACARGCASCCRFPVGVTLPEAKALASTLRTAANAPALLARVRDEARATAPLRWLDLAGRTCPLLLDGACSVYSARPVPCRALGSRDAEACDRSARGEAVPVPVADDAFAAGLAVGQALDAASGGHGHRELRSALAALLDARVGDEAQAFAGARRVAADGRGDSAPACGAR